MTYTRAAVLISLAAATGCTEESVDGPPVWVDGRFVATEVIDDELCFAQDDERRCLSLDDLTVTLATLPGGAPADPPVVFGDEPLLVHCSEIGDGALCP